MKSALVLLAVLTACQQASPGRPGPVSAGTLTKEYEESIAGVRRKYDGKEITVRGYVLSVPTLPQPGDDKGSILLEEKGQDLGRPVTCWFSQERAAEFSKIKGDQYVTVKGVFNGEFGAELKFCRLVRLE